jgi:hypothetical protein
VIPVRVQCYSGFKSDERPIRFVLGERTLEIVEIDDRWYSPDAIYFRVKGNDGNIYLLRHDEIHDSWSLEAFRYR